MSETQQAIWEVLQRTEQERDALAARLAEAVKWIERVGCPDDCEVWEPDSLDPVMLLNSGNCTCGRADILCAFLASDSASGWQCQSCGAMNTEPYCPCTADQPEAVAK